MPVETLASQLFTMQPIQPKPNGIASLLFNNSSSQQFSEMMNNVMRNNDYTYSSGNADRYNDRTSKSENTENPTLSHEPQQSIQKTNADETNHLKEKKSVKETDAKKMSADDEKDAEDKKNIEQSKSVVVESKNTNDNTRRIIKTNHSSIEQVNKNRTKKALRKLTHALRKAALKETISATAAKKKTVNSDQLKRHTSHTPTDMISRNAHKGLKNDDTKRTTESATHRNIEQKTAPSETIQVMVTDTRTKMHSAHTRRHVLHQGTVNHDTEGNSNDTSEKIQATVSSQHTENELMQDSHTSSRNMSDVRIQGKHSVDVVQERLTTDTSQSAREHASTQTMNRLFGKLVQRARFIINNRQSVVTMRMDPPHLGKLNLRFSLNNGTIVGKIIVESNEAQDMLKSNLHQLSAEFAKSGLNIDSFEVQVQQGGEGNGNANGYRQEVDTLSTAKRLSRFNDFPSPQPSIEREYAFTGGVSHLNIRV